MEKSELRRVISDMSAGKHLDQLVADYLIKGGDRPYSTEISWAWQLIELCRCEGILIKVECLLDTYRISWHYEDVYAVTPEEGICKLALFAKLDL